MILAAATTFPVLSPIRWRTNVRSLVCGFDHGFSALESTDPNNSSIHQDMTEVKAQGISALQVQFALQQYGVAWVAGRETHGDTALQVLVPGLSDFSAYSG